MDFHTALSNITKTSKSLTLFMAPMGWGKTRSVWGLLEAGEKIVFISPLRSIVEELSQRAEVITFKDADKKEVLKNFKLTKESKVLAITPESLSRDLLDQLLLSDYLFVLDEFHLFFDWGGSFREKLLLFWEELIFSQKRILALSASLEIEHVERVKILVAPSDYQVFVLDVGNFKFNNNPGNLKKSYHNQFLLHLFLYWNCLFFKRARIIIFVRRRKDVFIMKEKLRQLGIYSQTCVGGEVKEFCALERRYFSRIIISTSALSHGVNFRGIERVFVLFNPTKTIEFQMFGRGGRFGESYKIYGLKLKKNLFKEKAYNYANHLWIKLKAFS